MKAKLLLISFLAIVNLLSAQNNNDDVNKFITLFKLQMTKLTIGKIEEHYDQGYFKTLSESDYFDKNVEVGITTIYQNCSGKDEAASEKEIVHFFEQHKSLKLQRKEIDLKMNDFDFIKSYLKIRIYSDESRPLYENHGIVKSAYKGFVEVVVLDLPSGIGSLQKKYLEIWNKSENVVYSLAKENTLAKLDQKFEKAEVAKSGEEYYLLASDTDLFITSSVLDLSKTNIPIGEFGTLVSIPNKTAIVALPLNDSLKIKSFSLSFMGLTNHLYDSKETTPISDNLFWYNGTVLLLIYKDIKNKELIYPEELKKRINK